jgi:hypothetical protein
MRDSSYIFRLAIEPNQRSFARVQVLGGGDGCGEEREWAAQHFEARVYICLSDMYILFCTDRSILPALGLELLPPLVELSVCVGSVEDGVALI